MNKAKLYKTIKEKPKAGTIAFALSCLGIGVIAGLLILSNTGTVLVDQAKEYENTILEQRSWKNTPLPWLGDANPGSGNSGVLMFYVYQYNATPDYNVNKSSGSAYVYAFDDVNNSHAGSNVPFDTAFDVVWRVRWNAEHAYNGTWPSGSWELGWVNGWFNCSGLSVSTQECAEQQIGSNETYLWVNYYDNNSGSGYTIYRGQNVTSCISNFNAYC